MWVTIIFLLELDSILIITTYPSKNYEKQLYKHKKRLLREQML